MLQITYPDKQRKWRRVHLLHLFILLHFTTFEMFGVSRFLFNILKEIYLSNACSLRAHTWVHTAYFLSFEDRAETTWMVSFQEQKQLYFLHKNRNSEKYGVSISAFQNVMIFTILLFTNRKKERKKERIQQLLCVTARCRCRVGVINHWSRFSADEFKSQRGKPKRNITCRTPTSDHL